MLYFDHNATTPLCPPAREKWLQVQDRLWHNASSLYREAAAARDELERCRERLAEITGTEDPEHLIFTSGATEGCNGFFRALATWISAHPKHALRVRLSPFEHPAVREPAQKFCQATVMDRGEWERLIGPAQGLNSAPGPNAPSPEDARSSEPLVVAWMAANNETGEVFSWSQSPRSRGSDRLSAGLIHFCDASQWLGKLPAQAFAGASPVLVGCAHKFGGPKGVGFVRQNGINNFLDLPPTQLGGPQEHGRRAGTEDVASIAAMVAALEWSQDQLPGNPAPRDEFEHSLGWPVVAADRPRLWNTSMVVAPRHQNKLWLARLSQHGIQCSTGSACSSGKDGDFHVLHAMGLDPDAMRRVLRFSSGWTTSHEDWHHLRTTLATVEKELDAR
jgi:cysteine desulfurase